MEMSEGARNVSISLGLALSERMRRRASRDDIDRQIELLRLQLAEVLDLVDEPRAVESVHQAMELLRDLKRTMADLVVR